MLCPAYRGHWCRRMAAWTEVGVTVLAALLWAASGRPEVVAKCFPAMYGILPNCPYPPPGLGHFHVDMHAKPLQHSSQLHDDVMAGGRWRPNRCQAVQRVAILVPYRDRLEDLKVFLPNIHSFLKIQLLDYRVYIIEQGDDKHFNRGALLNVGFVESMKDARFDCIILHDVDKFPEETRNLYTCTDQPTHFISKQRYLHQLYRPRPYEDYFGGVTAMWSDHYHKINGFSNEFWGWGSEDDDLRNRIDHHKLSRSRVAEDVGRYLEIYHPYGFVNPRRHYVAQDGWKRFHSDGWNSIRYSVTAIVNEPLYTNITIKLLHQDPYYDKT